LPASAISFSNTPTLSAICVPQRAARRKYVVDLVMYSSP
jgi:hypothetical protein